MKDNDEHACMKCGEDTLNDEYCRECDIERSFASMTCSGCKRLRTTTDGIGGELANALYGADHRCACEPRPPTMLQLEAKP